MQIKKIIFLCKFICTLFGCLFSANTIAAQLCNECKTTNATQINLFKDNIQVQPMQATALIRSYFHNKGLNSGDTKFGCYTQKSGWGSDDCFEVTLNNKRYVFWFDDLSESDSDLVNKSVFGGACLIAGGKRDAAQGSNCYIDTSTKLDFIKDTFNMGVQNTGIKNTYTYYILGKIGISTIKHNGINIIDPYVFSKLQMGSVSNMHELIEGYSQIQFNKNGLIMDSMKCSHATRSLDNDDVVSCAVSYYDPTTNKNSYGFIDFVFDDLYEMIDSTGADGVARLTCKATGGQDTSKGACAGITQKICNDLKKHNIETEWNPDKGGCIMNAAATQYKWEKAKGYAGTAVAITLGVLAVPVSGGSSLLVITAVVGGVVTIIATIAVDAVQHIIDENFTAALIRANTCSTQTCKHSNISPDCRKCAQDSVYELVRTTTEFNGEYSDSDANAASYLIDKLSPIFLDGTMGSICLSASMRSIEQSKLVTTKKIAEGAQLLGAILTLGAGTTNAVKGAQNLGGKIANANAISSLGKTLKASKIMTYIEKYSSTIAKDFQDKAKLLTNKGKNLNKFIDSIGHGFDATDVMGYGSTVYDSWTASCTAELPCDKSIDDFINNFDNLCGA